MADGAGLPRGVDFRIRATIIDGGRELDLTNRTVSALGRLDSATTSFQMVTAVFDSESGQVDILGKGTDIADPNADELRVEFTITGVPVVNANEKPLVIPLRAAFAEAER